MRPEQKQPRWDTAQSLLHEKNQENAEVKNSYGSLKYIKEGKNRKTVKEGFVLEALEAPGTPVHTYQEKHLDPAAMKKVKTKREQPLYASGTPFQNQATFYDVREKRKGRKFLDCMKQMLKEGRYRTLQDTFGFLDQEPEKLLKEHLERERLRRLTLEEFDVINKQIDLLNGRLERKEAKERQLCARLQLMLDKREEKEKEELFIQERHRFPEKADLVPAAAKQEAGEAPETICGDEEAEQEEKSRKMS